MTRHHVTRYGLQSTGREGICVFLCLLPPTQDLTPCRFLGNGTVSEGTTLIVVALKRTPSSLEGLWQFGQTRDKHVLWRWNV